MKTKKIILPESQMPTQWYNIVSDMKNRPLPPLNPATKEPVTLEQMSALFAEELMKQEMSTERYYGHEIEMYTVEQGEKRDKRQ